MIFILNVFENVITLSRYYCVFVKFHSIHEYPCPIIINTFPFSMHIFAFVAVIVETTYIHVSSDNRIALSLEEQQLVSVLRQL